MSDQPTGRVSDEDIERARLQVARAFSLLGLAGPNGRPVCPACGTDKKGKVVLRDAKGYWKCHRCGTFGSPLKLMTEHGWHFVDAVNALLGREVSSAAKAKKPDKPVEVSSQPEFVATVDPDVYTWIAARGDRQAAADYYGRWHISADAVTEAGCFYLPLDRRTLVELQAAAVERFGRDRLIDAGVAMERDSRRRPRTAAERTVDGLYFPGMPPGYPVGEPHVRPDGKISYCQFRPDGKTREQVEAHKQAKKAKQRAEAAGVPFDGDVPKYKPPFLSLRGMPHDAMIGGGVWRLARLDPGATVVVVEGLKDLMAARTMGAEAYALPGAQTLPPPAVCDILARHRVLVALDGDDAGAAARDQVIDYLRDHGVASIGPKQLPDGMDVTDILVDRHAQAGCGCPTCISWRDDRAAA